MGESDADDDFPGVICVIMERNIKRGRPKGRPLGVYNG